VSAAAEATFRGRVRERLATLEPVLLPILGALISHKYPSDVVALDFEVFSDGFTSSFPVRAFFMDDSNTEFFVYADGVATYPSPVEPGLLDIEYVYPDTIEEELVGESPDSEPWELATSELLEWFLQCWMKAGGSAFGLAATISRHDSAKELNLKTGRQQARGSTFGA
jgi:hypothetical protein